MARLFQPIMLVLTLWLLFNAIAHVESALNR